MIPLRQAYEKQRQFAADASHELRTPLAVVMASAELLQNDPSIKSPFLRQVIDDVRDEVKKMTKLVSDLLVVARSDNKALKLKPQKFNLSALIEQTARLMQPLADQKKIDLRVLQERLGSRRLSFASPEDLAQKLGVWPGSVTPFAALNEDTHTVRVTMDADFAAMGWIGCHPCDNTASVHLRTSDLLALLADAGRKPDDADLGKLGGLQVADEGQADPAARAVG